MVKKIEGVSNVKQEIILVKLNQTRETVRRIKQRKRSLRDTKELETRYKDLCNTIKPFVAAIEDEEIREILTAYYIEGMSWTEIGDKLYLHRTTAQKRIQKYLMRG